MLGCGAANRDGSHIRKFPESDWLVFIDSSSPLPLNLNAARTREKKAE